MNHNRQRTENDDHAIIGLVRFVQCSAWRGQGGLRERERERGGAAAASTVSPRTDGRSDASKITTAAEAEVAEAEKKRRELREGEQRDHAGCHGILWVEWGSEFQLDFGTNKDIFSYCLCLP